MEDSGFIMATETEKETMVGMGQALPGGRRNACGRF